MIIHVMLFVVVMAITAVLFTGWVALTLVRAVWRALAGNRSPSPSIARGALETCMCARDRCHALNPIHALFCKRCGTAMGPGVAGSRRVAV